MKITSAPVAPVKPDITITLSASEAAKLRRVCYYNKTVAKKYRNNPVGGIRKAEDIDAFLGSLGSSLKSMGVERF